MKKVLILLVGLFAGFDVSWKIPTFFDKRSGRAKRQTPCVNADGKVDVADHVKLSDIIMNQNE